jgi:hypothetical protein
MVRIFIAILGALLIFLSADRGYGAGSSSDVAYSISFADYTGGPPLQWLAMKGFVPKRDAENQDRVVFSFANKSLVLETRKQAVALLLNEADVVDYSKIRIEWGVDAFPPGASYAKGVRSDAAMIYVFFGDRKLSSGSILIPDSPYFIGLFLCESDPIDEAFTGRYFKAGGRYVCINRATPGQTIISDYAIAAAFTRFFGKSEAPAISGLGISIDTESAKGNGVAKSFIRTIELVR